MNKLWLWKKLYLVNTSMYLTIVIVMTMPQLLTKYTHASDFLAKLMIFFFVALARAAYESLIVYEAPVAHLSPEKMLKLSGVTAIAITLLSHYLKPILGYFSIPVSLIFSTRLVGRLKEKLWPAQERPEPFAMLPAKLAANKISMYGFYAILVGITYLGYAKLHINFCAIFALGLFVGIMCEEIYNSVKVYEQEIAVQSLLSIFLGACVCTFLATGLVWTLVGPCGMAGQLATIISVVMLKLIQPVFTQKLTTGTSPQ